MSSKKGNLNPNLSTRFSSTRQPDGHKRPQELMKKMREMDAVEAPLAYDVLSQIRSGYVKYVHPDTGVEDYEKVGARERLQAATNLLEWARGKPQQSVEVAGGLSMDLASVINTRLSQDVGDMLKGS